MKETTKYFLFNKHSDYIRGCFDNIRIFENGFTVKDTSKKGIWFSRILDSKEKGNIWHRLIMEFEDFGNSTINMSIYSAESMNIIYNDEVYLINEILENKELNIEEKIKMLRCYELKQVQNPKDYLLHDIKGRYIWIKIELIPILNKAPIINRIKIIFPKVSWSKYLPGIYQQNLEENDFAERFLNIFQTMYEDLNEKVDKANRIFDVECVNEKYQEMLASWVGIESSYLWNKEQLRYLTKNAVSLYKKRGTSEYLKRILQLYIDKKVYIIECNDLKKYYLDNKKTKLLTELYGDNPYIFNIVIEYGIIKTDKTYKIIEEIIKNNKPAYMECNIIILEPYISLDKYSYLGINSYLGSNKSLTLDGQAAVSFIKI